MIPSSEKLPGGLQPNHEWGDFSGTIYRDFTLVYPAWIYSANCQQRSNAKPLAWYAVKAQGLKRRIIVGETQYGEFICDLIPDGGTGFLDTRLSGELKIRDKVIGIANIGPANSLNELGQIKSIQDDWTLSLSVPRNDPLITEVDAYISDSRLGNIVRIERRDYTWSEQVSSTFGFGRCKRGHFIGSVGTNLSNDQRVATVLLLICYFQLLELPFNTDTT